MFKENLPRKYPCVENFGPKDPPIYGRHIPMPSTCYVTPPPPGGAKREHWDMDLYTGFDQCFSYGLFRSLCNQEIFVMLKSPILLGLVRQRKKSQKYFDLLAF